MDLMHNIDTARDEIMRLENQEIFNQQEWAKVLIALSGRPAARADAVRRMETAKLNAISFVRSEAAKIAPALVDGNDEYLLENVKTIKRTNLHRVPYVMVVKRQQPCSQ